VRDYVRLVKRYFSANVRDDGSPLAFGADPAAAGRVTKVPKAWLIRSIALFAFLF